MHNYRIVLSLSSNKDTLTTCTPANIFDPLPSHTPQKHPLTTDDPDWHEVQFQQRGGKLSETDPGKEKEAVPPSLVQDYRFGPISVDWLDVRRTPKIRKKSAKGSQTQSSTTMASSSQIVAGGKETVEDAANAPKGAMLATFEPSSSNITFGTANLPQGTVRIFRDTILPSEESETTVIPTTEDGCTLAVLALPSFMTPADFLTWVSPEEENIAHLRMIRDSMPNRTMALIKFRNSRSAEKFGLTYNGREFHAMDPEICHVVRVLSIDIDTPDSSTLSFSLSTLTPATALASSGAVYELPTCPVCLERMDAAVTGLVTVPCSHTFHCACLSKWGDSRCPVCRYSQNLLSSHPSTSSSSRLPFNSAPSDPSTRALSRCASCSSYTNLWICLICGNVGCGRYGRAHAHQHYESSMHLYALELETQRVWDYAGDGYVHRLIQNKTDGKLVELPSASSMTTAALADSRGMGPGPADALAAEKIEAIGIEYSYLLTTQLDCQRAYFEDQQRLLKDAIHVEQAAQTELRERLAAQEREKEKTEGKVAKVGERAKALERELREEKMVSEGMMKNMDAMKGKMEVADKEKGVLEEKVKDLEEQLRDVMFFLQAKEQIEKSNGAGDGAAGEAAGGTVVIPPPMSTPARKRRGKVK
ncbi:hypothetical protein FRB94_012792 [Tulasnella sp. JGI-2019a]|nr:hypothetical protein FRB94_012792 [Tulasnella sp. JGI-2019a]KAG9018506.1 hypothetical protein FRB93_000209 [Tulasnella sp. JGI-2019a]